MSKTCRPRDRLMLVVFPQAEDGIRPDLGTGVQTEALPTPRFGEGLGGGFTLLLSSLGAVMPRNWEIGRASCRESVEISVVAVSLKKKNSTPRRSSCASYVSCGVSRRSSNESTSH